MEGQERLAGVTSPQRGPASGWGSRARRVKVQAGQVIAAAASGSPGWSRALHGAGEEPRPRGLRSGQACPARSQPAAPEGPAPPAGRCERGRPRGPCAPPAGRLRPPRRGTAPSRAFLKVSFPAKEKWGSFFPADSQLSVSTNKYTCIRGVTSHRKFPRDPSQPVLPCPPEDPHQLMLPVLELHRHGDRRCVFFCVWLFSLKAILLRLIHVSVSHNLIVNVCGIVFCGCAVILEPILHFYALDSFHTLAIKSSAVKQHPSICFFLPLLRACRILVP